MELARSDVCRVRQAVGDDAGEIGRLLGIAWLRHVHADWHLPVDWIGTPGFVLCELAHDERTMELVACLAVGADPPPAAWVRVAAVMRGESSLQQLREMLAVVLPWLQENQVSILGWLTESSWPSRWLRALGFTEVNRIITYSLDLRATELTETIRPRIRPATVVDMARLADIEQLAFEPLWRHSRHGLLLAFRQAVSFDVAEIDDRIVGFQYSVAGADDVSVHLVRLTVTPEAQGRGIGSDLMRTAFLGYKRIGAARVTLNTQADNHASHHLYERFGFKREGGGAAVWAIRLDR
ncbi:MAG: GNAT family N-acetyltransferase [Chloroflexota bacterium]|jgi:ribosomal-protein-alanine N-acetyltransferase